MSIQFIVLILFSSSFSCQNIEDRRASFPEGNEALEAYINENMQWQQSQLTVEGKVFVSFTIGADGSISNINIVKGLCPGCDEEAMRLIRDMPKWEPAISKGEKVSSSETLAIKFEL